MFLIIQIPIYSFLYLIPTINKFTNRRKILSQIHLPGDLKNCIYCLPKKLQTKRQ